MSLMSEAELAAKRDDPHQQTVENKWYEQLVALVPTERWRCSPARSPCVPERLGVGAALGVLRRRQLIVRPPLTLSVCPVM